MRKRPILLTNTLTVLAHRRPNLILSMRRNITQARSKGRWILHLCLSWLLELPYQTSTKFGIDKEQYLPGLWFQMMKSEQLICSADRCYTTVRRPENKRHEVTWQPRSPTQCVLVKAAWVPVVGMGKHTVPGLVYFTEASVLTGKEQLWFYTHKTSLEARLKKIHLHWWNCPPRNDVSQNKGEFQSIWKGRRSNSLALF